VANESALVALLYHADWTRLSLSADLREVRGDGWYYPEPPGEAGLSGWPGPPPWARPGPPPDVPGQEPPAHERTSRLLIAPGGRYRLRTPDDDGDETVRGCDGDRPWILFSDKEDGGHVRVFGAPDVPLPDLLRPSWLLSGFELVLEETAQVGGREAHRVVGRPRPIARSERGPGPWRDQVEAVIDAELGILLRCEQRFRGRMRRLRELRDVRFDPPEAADPGQFAPPPGGTAAESPDALFTGPGWRAAKIAAGAVAAGLGFAIRHAPHRPPQRPADEDAAMPRDEPETGGQPGQEQPVSGELISLLYRGGLAIQDVAAEVHEWADAGAAMEQARSAADAAGFFAAGIPRPGYLAGALSERVSDTHRVARIRIAAPDRYRIDYLSGGPKHRPRAIVCDGQRRWKVYQDRVAVGPAVPLPRKIAHLIDPSWLLQWQLSGGAEVTVGGRRGLRIRAVGSPGSHGPPSGFLLPPAEAVTDAELGILLRLTSYAGRRPAMRFELRDVSIPGAPADGDFRLDVPPGMRTVTHSGSLLDEVDAPEAVKLAARTATGVVRQAGAAASAVSGFLDGLRGKGPPGPQP
jgi:hypothetical protein